MIVTWLVFLRYWTLAKISLCSAWLQKIEREKDFGSNGDDKCTDKVIVISWASLLASVQRPNQRTVNECFLKGIKWRCWAISQVLLENVQIYGWLCGGYDMDGSSRPEVTVFRCDRWTVLLKLIKYLNYYYYYYYYYNYYNHNEIRN